MLVNKPSNLSCLKLFNLDYLIWQKLSRILYLFIVESIVGLSLKGLFKGSLTHLILGLLGVLLSIILIGWLFCEEEELIVPSFPVEPVEPGL